MDFDVDAHTVQISRQLGPDYRFGEQHKIENTVLIEKPPKTSVHSLRHMYATILMEQGVQLPKISALLGHESVNTTLSITVKSWMRTRKSLISFDKGK